MTSGGTPSSRADRIRIDAVETAKMPQASTTNRRICTGFCLILARVQRPIDRLSLDNDFDRGYNLRRSLARDNFINKLL